MPIDALVEKTVAEHGMLSRCDGLILAVSGGSDSMGMLALFAELPREFPLTVAHVHHGLRKESDREEAMVRDFCKVHDLPCAVFHTQVKRELKKGETVESAARRIRYEFFRTLAKERRATHIATAHTKDDQCETVLLHLLHGAGPKGLCGILPKRREGEFTLIRPLIDCTKEQVLEYCRIHGVPYLEDASNEDLSYTRNRIRHEILPRLEQINPKVREAICRTADALQEQQRAFEDRAEEFLSQHPQGIPTDRLRALPRGEQAEILRRLFERHGKILSSEQTKQALALLEKETGTVEFDRCYRLHSGQNLLTLTQTEHAPFAPRKITQERTRLEDGRMLFLEKVSVTEQNRALLIPARLPLILRTRKEGDCMKTSGGTKTLKKYMMEKRIPQPLRDRLLLLEEHGTVLWCEKTGTNRETQPKIGEEGYFVSLSEE